MTQEEKARAYDDAVNKFAHLLEDTDLIKGELKENIICIFPELKRSEHENLKKELIDFLREGKNYSCPNSQKRQKWADWVEKQEFNDNNELFEIKRGNWYMCVSDYLFSDTQETMFEHGKVYYATNDWRLERKSGDGRNVKNLGIHGYTNFFRPATKEEIYNHLNKSEFAKKTKWSKEDREMLNAIINNFVMEDPLPTSSHSDWIKFLKNIQSKFNWKPTEEQLGALQRITQETVSTKDIVIVQKLWSQLKEL